MISLAGAFFLINLLLHLECKDGHRQVSELVEVWGYDGETDQYELATLYPRSQQAMQTKAGKKSGPSEDGCD